MRSALRSLRVRFAIVAFLAIYVPVLALLGVTLVVEEQVDILVGEGLTSDQVQVTTSPSPVLIPVGLALAPVAAGLAWWLAGRAVRPVEEAVAVQGRLIEETSHELRTPLAVLTNSAQILLDHPEPSLELFREGIERSGAAAERMTRTIDGLLLDARSRSREITRTRTDLTVLVSSVVDELRSASEAKSVDLELVGGGSSIPVAVDEPALARAVANLVTNAIEHSPVGGTVTVEVVGGDGSAEVVVTDRGPGVAPDDQDRIFERFWTRRPDGTGLGLAVVRQVAEAHGGTVTLVSPVGDAEGARFALRLPLGQPG